ncbi:hypothetical protein BDR06DRAFT_955663 [Suillus hirtellus]|nr:hypothetical protein BDR06DRAFT_955663 [Suillus hirtellus]
MNSKSQKSQLPRHSSVAYVPTLCLHEDGHLQLVLSTTRMDIPSGKLSHTTQFLHVQRARLSQSKRRHLVTWKAGLASILEVTSTQKRGTVRL